MRQAPQVDDAGAEQPLTCSAIVSGDFGIPLHPLPRYNAGLIAAMSDGVGHAAVAYSFNCSTGMFCGYAFDLAAICGDCDGGIKLLPGGISGGDGVSYAYYPTENGFVVYSAWSNGHPITAYLGVADTTSGASNRVQITFGHDGNNAVAWRPKPSGGAYVVYLNDYGPVQGQLTLHGYDSSLADQGNTLLMVGGGAGAGEGIIALGTSVDSSVFVVWRADGTSDWTAGWFDKKAQPLSASFSISPPAGATGARVQPLLDGSVVLVVTRGPTDPPIMTRYTETSTSVPPEWLSVYGETELTPISGDRAYAAVHGVTCNGIELLTATGESCGCIFPDNDGGGQPVSIGADGSVFVYHPYPGDGGLDWYPRLLK